MSNFSLADNKPVPQIQFRECGPLTANKTEGKKLKNDEIQDMVIKMN